MSELPNFIANPPILVGAFLLIVILLARNLLVDSLAGIPSYPPAQVVLLINHKGAAVPDARGHDACKSGHVRQAAHATPPPAHPTPRLYASSSSAPSILAHPTPRRAHHAAPAMRLL